MALGRMSGDSVPVFLACARRPGAQRLFVDHEASPGWHRRNQEILAEEAGMTVAEVEDVLQGVLYG